MCRKFDLRFFVIADRYQFIDGEIIRERSLEDIKERYYQVCQRLARSRNTTEESAFDYNKGNSFFTPKVMFKNVKFKENNISRSSITELLHKLLYCHHFF
jgi:hypothetical protein